jgi:hypothetical protein
MSPKLRLAWLISGLLVLGACKATKEAVPKRSETKPEVKAKGKDESKKEEEKKLETRTKSITEVPGVVGLDLSPVSLERWKKARSLNEKGMRLHKQKKYKEASKVWTEALKADPGYIVARYNLACATALLGEKDKTLRLLRQLREDGCILCLKQLLYASKDPDFIGLYHVPDFEELIDGINVTEPDYRKATIDVLNSISRYDFRHLYQSLDDGKRIVFDSDSEYCGEGATMNKYQISSKNEIQSRFITRSRKKLEYHRYEEKYSKIKIDIRRFGQFAPPVFRWPKVEEVEYDIEIEKCINQCCYLKEPQHYSNVLFVRKICFWPENPNLALPIYFYYYYRLCIGEF